MLGLVSQHQECQGCLGDLSRTHGEECSGARIFLQNRFPKHPWSSIDATESWITHMINKYPKDQTPPYFHRDIAVAIGKIYRVCRGKHQEPNGYWKSFDDAEAPFIHNTESHVIAPVTGSLTNPQQSQSNRAASASIARRIGGRSELHHNEFSHQEIQDLIDQASASGVRTNHSLPAEPEQPTRSIRDFFTNHPAFPTSTRRRARPRARLSRNQTRLTSFFFKPSSPEDPESGIG